MANQAIPATATRTCAPVHSSQTVSTAAAPVTIG